jgi:flagellar biosynthesis GTPase FlhF
VVESTKAPDDCTTGFELGTIIEPFINYDWDDGCRISHKKEEAEGICAKCQKLRDYLIDLERRCLRISGEMVERERLTFRENGWVGMPEAEAVDDDWDRFNEDTFGKEEEDEDWDEGEDDDENEGMDEEDGALPQCNKPFRLSKRQLRKIEMESEQFKKSEAERQKKYEDMQQRREKLLTSWSEVAERERLLEEQRKSLHWTDRRYTPEMIEEEKAKSEALIRELNDDYLARAWP